MHTLHLLQGALGRAMRFIFFLGFTLLMWQGTAMAQTAVLDVEGKGLSKETSKTLTSILRNEAQQTLSSQVVNKTPVNLSEFVVLLGCDASTLACLSKVAKQLKAKRLLIGKLDKEPNNKYRMKIDLFDAKQDKITSRFQKVVDGTDINVTFRMEAEQFFKNIITQAQAATLKVNSNVRGATVTLNGKKSGTTPFARTGMKPGKYKIEVTSKGFSTWRLTLEMAPKSTNSLTATLERRAVVVNKTPLVKTDPKVNNTTTTLNNSNSSSSNLSTTTTPSDQLESTNWGAWSLVTIGGVALVGSGITGVLMKNIEGDLRDRFIDDDLTRDDYDELTTRGRNYQTAHRVLLGAGLASAAIGGLWLLFDSPDNQNTGAMRLYPTGSGIEASITW